MVVVDNNSSDDSVAMVKKEFPECSLIELPKNIGFAAGNNAAIRVSGTDYLFLLNSDTYISENHHLDQMFEYLSAQLDCSVISPRVELSNGKLDPACHRGEPTPWAALCYFTGLEKIFPNWRVFAGYHQGYKDLAAIHEVDSVSGAAMAVKRDTMDDVGFLDEQFFMYAEDLDWCHRFRKEGYKVLFFPMATVTHTKYQSGLKHVSSDKTNQKTSQHFYDTMIQYYDKYYLLRYPQFVRDLLKFLVNIKRGVA